MYSITVIRYLSNGVTDNSFGKNGITTVDSISGYMVALAVQKDGRILVADNSFSRSAANDVTVVRLLPNGTVDKEYGTNGYTGLNFNDDAAADAAVLQRMANFYWQVVTPKE